MKTRRSILPSEVKNRILRRLSVSLAIVVAFFVHTMYRLERFPNVCGNLEPQAIEFLNFS